MSSWRILFLINRAGKDDQGWWHIPILLALRRLRQENWYRLEANIGYTLKTCLKKTKAEIKRTGGNKTTTTTSKSGLQKVSA